MSLKRTLRQLTGDHAESRAEKLLKDNGFRILQRNYSCRAGEIDLIARRQNTLVFVEVRFRKTDNFGSAAATVTAGKQAKIMRAAEHYLVDKPELESCNCRFDVIAITGNAQEWIENAFAPYN